MPAGRPSAGWSNLAARILWALHRDGDGDRVGYDIFSFDTDGSERLVEVEMTNDCIARRFTSPATSLMQPGASGRLARSAIVEFRV